MNLSIELESRLQGKGEHLATQQRVLAAQCAEVERRIEEPFDAVWRPELTGLLRSRRALLSAVDAKLASFAAAAPVAEAALEATRAAVASLELANAERAKGTRDRKVAVARAADCEFAQQTLLACRHDEKVAVDAVLALCPHNAGVAQIPGRDIAESLRAIAFNSRWYPERSAPSAEVQKRWLAIGEDELQGLAHWASHFHAQLVVEGEAANTVVTPNGNVRDWRREDVVLSPDEYRDALRNFRAHRREYILATAAAAARTLEAARAQVAALEASRQLQSEGTV